MKANILIAALLSVSLCLTFGFTRSSRNKQSMSTPIINKRALPEDGLTLIGPSDPSYNEMIASLSHNNPDASVIETLRPYSIFVKNANNKAVVACILKWELIEASGKIKTETTGFIATWRLMTQGVSGTDGSIISSNSVWFFPPSNIEVFQEVNKDLPVSLDAASERMRDNIIKELAARFGQYTSINVTLDGVFFEDGTFVGPDTTQFFTQVETLRNARRDLYNELAQSLKEGKSATEVFKTAENLASNSELQPGSFPSTSNLYNQTKKNVAEEILRMRKRIGDHKALDFVMQPLRTAPVELKKK